MVIIRGHLIPPGLWPLARVTAVHPGSDGRVRALTRKTVTSTLQRSITKIVLLLVEEGQEDLLAPGPRESPVTEVASGV